jgi:hypothetical protein
MTPAVPWRRLSAIVPADKSVFVDAVEVASRGGYALFAMTSVLISLLQTLRGLVRSRMALHLELLALRHQVHVLQPSRSRRVRLMKADRWLWAWLSTSWCAWRTALVIVKPETVIAWHRQGFGW